MRGRGGGRRADGPGGSGGGRGPSELARGQGGRGGPPAPGQRWSVARQREVVLRLLRGEAAEDLARELGVPAWKLRTMRELARGGDEQGLGTAIRAVARADAEVKGASGDAAYALERMVLTVARARRG